MFEELLERQREKEEKEARKRQRLADDFSDLLYSIKVLSGSVGVTRLMVASSSFTLIFSHSSS